MVSLRATRWGKLLVLVALATAVATPGAAQEPQGRLDVWVYDAVTGVRITDKCLTVTLPGDSTPIEPVDHRYPVGTYDVLVEDCAGDYAPVLWESVDIGPESILGSVPILYTFMEVKNRAVVAGRVVDAYSGYPLRDMTVRLWGLDGTGLDYVQTDDFGIYHLYAEPDVPVLVTFKDNQYYDHRRQWYPYSNSIDGAQSVTPRIGTYTVANAALDIDGGIVGRIVDPDDPSVPAKGCSVRAWSDGGRSYTSARTDGSFTLQRTGDVTVEVHCDGGAGGFLADPDDPTRAEEWRIERGDSIDIGLIGVESEPAISGRVVDQNGHGVPEAIVVFFAQTEPAIEPATSGKTDSRGYFVTHEPLEGSYTAMTYFLAEQNGLTRADHFNATWLGNTADRSEALYLEFDGSHRGNVEFVVNRGETSRAWPSTIETNGPLTITTDRERDGATRMEPLEVSALATAPSYTIIGTLFSPFSSIPGFDSVGQSATIIYSPEAGSTPLEVEFVRDLGDLAGPADDIQTVWNGRLLPSCGAVAPPCEVSRSIDERGDYVISIKVTAGGSAVFVWGPSFLDTGVSIFRDDIEWLADEGVTKGCSPPINDLFCPDDQVTRGQMAAFLVRFLGLTDRGNVDFIDDDGSVFEADIERLANAGITRGCNPPANDQFYPHDPVTREQMAAFLTRALRLPAASGIDFDDDDGSIFEDAIEKLAAAGITRGCNPPVNNQFCPSAIVTREQMAAFLHRADSILP